MLFLKIILILIFFILSFYTSNIEKYSNKLTEKYKIGIIITTNGSNNYYLNNTIKYYLQWLGNDVIIIIITKININYNAINQFSNVYYLQDKSNYDNIGKSWNIGINYCIKKKCKFIFISSDSLLLTKSIKLMYNYCINKKNINYYYGPVINQKKTYSKNQSYKYHNQGKYFINQYIDRTLLIFNIKTLIKHKYNDIDYFNPNTLYPEIDWYKRFKNKGGKSIIFSNTLVYNYNFNPNLSKICLYTINTGGYEGYTLPFNNINNKYECDCLIFTDNEKLLNKCIDKNIIPFYIKYNYQDPQKLQRFIKTEPHTWLPNIYDISVYIDGNLRFIKDNSIYSNWNTKFSIKNLVNKLLNDNDLVCWYHWRKNSIKKGVNEELDIITKSNLASLNSVNMIKKFMDKDGFIDNFGLTETNILIRKHKNLIEFSNSWSNLVNICRRDQASFDYLLWKYNVKFHRYPYKDKPVYLTKHVSPKNRFIKLDN